MLNTIDSINSFINNIVWGWPGMILLLGVGLYLTLGSKFLQFRKFGFSMKQTIGKIFDKMKGCGFNTVVIWPSCFWWEEKSPEYPFKTGKEILRMAEKKEIKVIMELAGQLHAMEYMPDFKMKDEYYATEKEDAPGDDDRPAVNEAEFIIAKNRHGPTTTVKVAWNGDYTMFTNLETIRNDM